LFADDSQNSTNLQGSDNFGRIHQSLRVTPAMEAGIADHFWGLDEMIALLF